MGFISIALILFQPVLFYCILSISQKLQVVWICSGMSLGLIAYFKHITGNNTYQNLFYINEYDLFLLTLSLSWMCLKCNSYYLSEYKPRFLDFFGYCFYMPTIFTGPFIPYEDYRRKYVSSKCLPFNKRLKRLLYNILYCLFCFGFGNVCLHFIYIHAAAYHPQVSSNSYNLIRKWMK